MKIGTKQILTVLDYISWGLFIGLCVQTGVFIFQFIQSFFDPSVAQKLNGEFDLSTLYNSSIGNYSVIVSGIIILSGLKAFMFFLVLRIFLKTDFRNPFKIKLVSYIAKISYSAFLVWIITLFFKIYSVWLIKQEMMSTSEVDMRNYFGGLSEFLFLGIIVFVISQIFKRGIEIQSENNLTI